MATAVEWLLFVTGALGLEMIGGIIAVDSGMDSVAFVIGTTIEELLEMVGMAVFIFALARYRATIPDPDATHPDISAGPRVPRQRSGPTARPEQDSPDEGDFTGQLSDPFLNDTGAVAGVVPVQRALRTANL